MSTAATAPPAGELDPRFSEPGAPPTAWVEVERTLGRAELYWLSTVRADGRPHVTPLIAVWLDGVAYLCSGPDEQKVRNLERGPVCALTTGRNDLVDGLDVVVEGLATRVTDEARLRLVAAAYEEKYGTDWVFAVEDGAFFHDHGGRALVFEIAPTTVFAFNKGPYSVTRWRSVATR